MYKTLDNGVWLDFTKQEKNDYLRLRECITQDRVDKAHEFLSTFTERQRKKLINAQKIDKLSEEQTIYESYALLLARGRPMLEYLVSQGLELQIPNVNYSYIWRSGLTDHHYSKLQYLLESGVNLGSPTSDQFLIALRESSWASTGGKQTPSRRLEEYYSLLLCLAKRLTLPELSTIQYDFFYTLSSSFGNDSKLSADILQRSDEVSIELVEVLLGKGFDINQPTRIKKASSAEVFCLYSIHEIISSPRSAVFHHLIGRSSVEQIGLFIAQIRERDFLVDQPILDYLEQHKIVKEKALLEELSPSAQPSSITFSHKMKI